MSSPAKIGQAEGKQAQTEPRLPDLPVQGPIWHNKGMGRTAHKPRKDPQRGQVVVDNTTIDRATPEQLRVWLNNPPSPKVASSWGAGALKRCLELDRKDLFEQWLNYCPPTGNITANTVLVNRAGSRVGTLLAWTAELSAHYFVDVVRQIDNPAGWQQLGELDWNRVIPHLEEKDVRALATMAALGVVKGLPAEKLLAHCGGTMSEGWELERVLRRTTSIYWATPSVVGAEDAQMARKLNSLEVGALLEAPVADLALFGALLTASVAEEHVSLALDETQMVGRKIKRKACRDFSRMFQDWNRVKAKADDIERAVDNVVPYIEWKKKDRTGNYALNVMNLNRWPEQAVIKLIDRILEACPALFEATGAEGLPAYQSPGNCDVVRGYLDAHRKKNKLTQRLKHNVRQTQALREAMREPTEERPKERPRPKM